jgi:hypothetical protein
MEFTNLLLVLMFILCFQDECKRLRQSIKCGLIKWLTVVSLTVMFPAMSQSRNLLALL